MLNKVLKYDLKYMYKVLSIFYIITLILSLLTRVFWLFENSAIMNFLGNILSAATISFMISILFNNILRIWSRFIKNLYGDESYLTHTLPVKKETIYISKFLASIITTFTSVLVIILALFIAYYSLESFTYLRTTLEGLATIYGNSVFTILFTFFFIFFLEMAAIIIFGYTGIIIGHKSNDNKMLKSIAVGFCLYLLTSALVILCLYIYGTLNPDIMNLFLTNEPVNISIVKTALLFGIIYYIIDIKLLKSGINVE